MRIGIEINGVLRDIVAKMEQVYQKYLIDEMDENSDFVYEMDLPVTSFEFGKHFKFKDDDEFYSFLYEEFVMQLFGHAPSTESSTFYDYDELYQKYKQEHRFILFSDDIGKAKPATLFFMSKFACQCDKIIFINKFNENEFLSDVDMIVTTNPNLLSSDTGKIMVKYEMTYNKDVETELTISNFKELGIILENQLQNA
jgi:predicted Zn-dependent protease with MMP-like domain